MLALEEKEEKEKKEKEKEEEKEKEKEKKGKEKEEEKEKEKEKKKAEREQRQRDSNISSKNRNSCQSVGNQGGNRSLSRTVSLRGDSVSPVKSPLQRLKYQGSESPVFGDSPVKVKSSPLKQGAGSTDPSGPVSSPAASGEPTGSSSTCGSREKEEEEGSSFKSHSLPTEESEEKRRVVGVGGVGGGVGVVGGGVGGRLPRSAWPPASEEVVSGWIQAVEANIEAIEAHPRPHLNSNRNPNRNVEAHGGSIKESHIQQIYRLALETAQRLYQETLPQA